MLDEQAMATAMRGDQEIRIFPHPTGFSIFADRPGVFLSERVRTRLRESLHDTGFQPQLNELSSRIPADSGRGFMLGRIVRSPHREYELTEEEQAQLVVTKLLESIGSHYAA